MVLRTSKRKSNDGQMIQISPYKAKIAQGNYPPGLGPEKAVRILKQVQKRQEDLERLKKWSPKASRQDRRKKRQVGS